MSKVTHTDVVLLLDASTQLCDYNRFEKIKSDSKAFCDTLVTDSNANIRCSIISFSSQLGHRTLAKSTNNVSELNTAIDNIQSGAGSYLAQAILRANDIMSSNSTNQKYYIIVSDGVIFDAYDTNNALATAKASFSNLKILTIGYNTESYGQDYLNSLVTPSTAEFNTNYQAKYTATNNIPDLEGAYNQICSQLIGHGINKYKSESKQTTINDGISIEETITGSKTNNEQEQLPNGNANGNSNANSNSLETTSTILTEHTSKTMAYSNIKLYCILALLCVITITAAYIILIQRKKFK